MLSLSKHEPVELRGPGGQPMASAPQHASDRALATAARDPANRRAIFAWCLYDWANSAFPTVIGTFIFSTYFTQAIAVTPETGTAQWGRAPGTPGILVALADRKSTRLNSSH